MQTQTIEETKVQTETRRVVAFLSVYEIVRCYGGPEEGGWWYDAYEHTGASFPYEATQVFEFIEDEKQRELTPRDSAWYSGPEGEWKPKWDENPVPADEPTRVRVESVRHHFESIYGAPDTHYRGSCAQRQPDYAFIHELEVGERANRPRPRYE